jgi:CheY-specific phosphatase CheX
MTRCAGVQENELLKQVLDRIGSELTHVITDAVLKTVKAMFGQGMYAVQGRTGQDVPPCYAASVVLVQGTSCLRLRLAFDGPLLRTLIAAVYPLEAANLDDALRDVASEISNIIAGHLKTFVNQKGFNVSRDLPVVENVATGADAVTGSFSLNFSIFRNSLSVRNLLNVSLL